MNISDRNDFVELWMKCLKDLNIKIIKFNKLLIINKRQRNENDH